MELFPEFNIELLEQFLNLESFRTSNMVQAGDIISYMSGHMSLMTPRNRIKVSNLQKRDYVSESFVIINILKPSEIKCRFSDYVKSR